MTEEGFVIAAAKTARESDNPRLKEIISYCTSLYVTGNLCGGNPEQASDHAAVVASSIMAEINAYEADGVLPDYPVYGDTFYSRRDTDHIQFHLSVDSASKSIRVQPSILTHAGTTTFDLGYIGVSVKGPLKVKLNEDVTVQSAIVSA